MKKINLILVLLIASVRLFAQGIKFDQSNTWNEVVAKATAENKNIFIDFYATWCGPCKILDKEVYTNTEVGSLVNQNFISVKVQTDKTSGDSANVRAFYNDAAKLANHYNVKVLPTLLFIKPNGEVLNSGYGAISVGGFIDLTNDALNPDRHYTKLKEQFLSNNLSIEAYPFFGGKAALAGDQSLAAKVYKNYKTNYLDKLKDKELLEGKNIQFMAEHPDLISSKDRIFYITLKQRYRIPEKFRNLCIQLIKDIIGREEINDKLYNGDGVISKNPDWTFIEASIRRKYGRGYEKLLFDKQYLFCRRTKNWELLIKLVDRNLQKKPLEMGDKDRAWDINNRAWSIFVECSDPKLIERALKWSEMTIAAMGENRLKFIDFLDTKANLLYKLGRVYEAIDIETEVVHINERDQISTAEYKPTLEKMKKGVKTWE